MTERNGNGGNLTIAIIIALVVGVAVYFLIDTKPAGDPYASVTTGELITGTTSTLSGS